MTNIHAFVLTDLLGVREIDDLGAEAVLGEVPVKGQDRVEFPCLDQGEGCAVCKTEILVMMPKEDAFGLDLDRRRDP